MSRTLQLQVLGPFAARWSDGESLELTTRKARALLALLALEPRGASRERVANLLWGDRNDDRARHNVRQLLSQIRAVCGQVVHSSGDRLTLDRERCSVDLAEFDRLAGSSEPEALSRCLELYRGDLLEGIAAPEEELEAWLFQTRDQLRARACDSMDRLVGLQLTGERYQDAIAVLGRRLSMDPACEPAHRKLMQVYARTGRRSEALRQYAACSEALKRELGAEPSADTRALREEIRAAQPIPPATPLRTPTAALASEGSEPTVAVLPFERISAGTDDYFADGITEDIITALSRFHALHVIARGSTFVYKGQDTPDREIAEALGAQFLVRGSVQRDGARVRINVQLLDGSRGVALWAHRYDRELTDVFQVQDEITATIVSTLAGRVEAAELTRARAAASERLEAYDYLLRGKDHHHRFSARDCAACIDLFQRAIDRDPSYAAAHAWLACGLGQALVFALDEQAALVDRAEAAVVRGLELDENDSECHRVLAQIQLTRGNLARALRHQQRALFLNPNDDRSVCSMGEILVLMGRPEEAEHWVRKSLSLNPYHPPRYWSHLARAVFHQGRFADTLEILEQIGRSRQDDLAYAVAASVHLGDQDAVSRNADALRVAFPDFSASDVVGALPYARDEDRRLLADALARAGF
ncbi:MAG: hypothetical protein JSW68_01930 [Burkholderiales bacterium]|nr:MAG: hypothetical protein JSW68_01930 [Burkholderiales bacterium]